MLCILDITWPAFNLICVPVPDLHWPRHVFDGLFACILKGGINLAGKMIMDRPRYADATSLRQTFKSSSNVDSVSQYVLTIDDNVAEIDPDAVLYASFFRIISIGRCQLPLYLQGALYGGYDAHELNQQTIASCFYDSATMGRNLRTENCLAVRPLTRNRAFLIQPHEP